MSWDGDTQLSWTRAQDGLNQLMVHGNHLVRAVGQTTTLTSLARKYHNDSQANISVTTNPNQSTE